MILNDGQPEAWRVHTEDDAAPTLYAERPPAILHSIKKNKYDLLFPLDFAGTLCARDGIKTGPHSPNGEDAYDRKLVCMRVRRKKKQELFENHKTDSRIRKIEVCPTMGALRSANATNDNPQVVTCFSGPQDHSVTRGYMNECAPTLNAAAGMSGNNRPFIVRNKKVFPINSMVIGKDGANGDRQTFEIGLEGDPCPTLQTSHHHAVAIIKEME